MGSRDSAFNLLDSADLAVLEPDFDSVRMVRRTSQNILDDPFGLGTAALVLLEHDVDGLSGLDVFSIAAVQDKNLLIIYAVCCASAAGSCAAVGLLDWRAGSVMVNVVPSPGVLSALICPRWRPTILRQMVKPRSRTFVFVATVQALKYSENSVCELEIETDAVVLYR